MFDTTPKWLNDIEISRLRWTLHLHFFCGSQWQVDLALFLGHYHVGTFKTVSCAFSQGMWTYDHNCIFILLILLIVYNILKCNCNIHHFPLGLINNFNPDKMLLNSLIYVSSTAMASTPDNRSTRPVSAPVMSPVSPGDVTPSPLLRSLHRSDRRGGSASKGRRSDRKADLKAESRPADSTKGHSPRPESTPEIKVGLSRICPGYRRGNVDTTSCLKCVLLYCVLINRKGCVAFMVYEYVTCLP